MRLLKCTIWVTSMSALECRTRQMDQFESRTKLNSKPGRHERLMLMSALSDLGYKVKIQAEFISMPFSLHFNKKQEKLWEKVKMSFFRETVFFLEYKLSPNQILSVHYSSKLADFFCRWKQNTSCWGLIYTGTGNFREALSTAEFQGIEHHLHMHLCVWEPYLSLLW